MRVYNSKSMLLRLTSLVIVMAFVVSLSAQFAGGDGTEADPYQVATADHLNLVRNYLGAANTNTYFVQTRDIDLGVAPWNEEQGWNPIGAAGNAFQGKFNGGGFAITNLTINRNVQNQGLFGYLIGAHIEDVHVLNANITAHQNVGALAGMSESNTNIRSCSSSGRVSASLQAASGNVGGLVGNQTRSVISRSFSTAFVTGLGAQTGGLLGYNRVAGVVSECYATGVVIGGVPMFSNTGGLVGYNQGTRDVDCGTLIEKSFSSGFVTTQGGSFTGGLVGRQFGAIIANCYSTAAVVSFGSFSGCLIGQHCCSSTLINSYAVGFGNLGCATRGGLMCQQQTSVTTNSFWDTQATGNATSAQGIGRTTEQMLQRATFTEWNFDEIWRTVENVSYPVLRWQPEAMGLNIPGPSALAGTPGNGTMDIVWNAPPELIGPPNGYNLYRNGVRVNDELITERVFRDTGLENFVTYSYNVKAFYNAHGETLPSATALLTPVMFAGGSGTVEDPFQIANANHLDAVRYVLNGHFVLVENIDLGVAPWNEGEGWVPIGPVFRGSLDGGRFEIQNLRINRANTADQGLFKELTGANIRKLGVSNVNVIGAGYTGGLSGRAGNTDIADTYVTGNVRGTFYVGGMVGWGSPARVTRSYSTGRVEGTSQSSYAGGIIGYGTSLSAITDSYSTMSVVTNTNHAGGLVGYNAQVNITRSYATGSVSSVNPGGNIGGLIGQHANGAVIGSFWNVQTTGQTQSQGGGTGLETGQMLRAGSFEEAGWEFPDTWRIVEGETYPFLAWQETAGLHNRPGPFNLTADAVFENLQIHLEWEMRGAPARYNIFRNNVQVGSVNHPTVQWTDTNTQAYTFYNYQVVAVFIEDEVELLSSPSNTVVTILVLPFSGGTGTVEDPYLIRTYQQLNNIRYGMQAHYLLLHDIDVPADQAWVPIGGSGARFMGSLDGGNNTIDGIRITTGASFAGFFGGLQDATVKNLKLTNASVLNIQTQAGGFAGLCQSSILENISFHGTVTSRSNFSGGFIGYFHTNSQIIDCQIDVSFTSSSSQGGGLIGYSSGGSVRNTSIHGSVTGSTGGASSDFGGFMGYNGGTTISNCYGMNSVTMTNAAAGGVGGFIGRSTAAISNSYYAGEVTAGEAATVGGFIGQNTGNVTNSYWDTEASGRLTSAGGTPRASRQMRHPYDGDTYTGWDFAEIWAHDEAYVLNDGYPVFRYQWQPPDILDSPVVVVDMIMVEGVRHIRIRWEAIEHALSYKVYASQNPYAENWGDPIRVLGENTRIYTEAINPEINKFFRVTASNQEAREGRNRRSETARDVAR